MMEISCNNHLVVSPVEPHATKSKLQTEAIVELITMT